MQMLAYQQFRNSVMKAVYYHIENDFGTLVSRKKEKRTMKEVQVIVNNYMEVKPIHNVIGHIKGSEEPGKID